MKNRDNKEEDKAVDDNKDDNNGPNYILIISIIISALIIIVIASIFVCKKLKAKKDEKLEKDIRKMQSAKNQVTLEQEITNKQIKFKN